MKTIGQIVVALALALFLSVCMYGLSDLISTVHVAFVKGHLLGFVLGTTVGISYWVWKFIKELEARS